MTKKIRPTPELVKKAEKVFHNTKAEFIMSGEGLSRGELRALERVGYIRKTLIFTKGKYIESRGSQQYRWQLVKNLTK